MCSQMDNLLRGGSYCIVKGCSSSRKDRNVIFHRLPKDVERCKKWLTVIGREEILNKPSVRSYRICGNHFRSSDYINVSISKSLIWNAVPSVDCNNEEVEPAVSFLMTDDQPTAFSMNEIEFGMSPISLTNDQSSTCNINVEESVHSIVEEVDTLRLTSEDVPVCCHLDTTEETQPAVLPISLGNDHSYTSSINDIPKAASEEESLVGNCSTSEEIQSAVSPVPLIGDHSYTCNIKGGSRVEEIGVIKATSEDKPVSHHLSTSEEIQSEVSSVISDHSYTLNTIKIKVEGVDMLKANSENETAFDHLSTSEAYPIIERIWSLNTSPGNICTTSSNIPEAHPVIEDTPTMDSTSVKNEPIKCYSNKPKGYNSCIPRNGEDRNNEVSIPNCDDTNKNSEKCEKPVPRKKDDAKKFQVHILRIDRSVQRIHKEILTKRKCELPITFRAAKLIDGSIQTFLHFENNNEVWQVKGDENLHESNISVASKILPVEKEIYFMENIHQNYTLGREHKEKLVLKLDHKLRSKKPFVKCTVNEEQFNNRSMLLVDERTPFCEKPFENNVCEKEFSENHLKDSKIVHTGENSYECNECGKTFSRQYCLKRHQRRVHFVGRRCEFNVCGEKFSRNCYLQVCKKNHREERAYLCSVCGYQFSLQKDLEFHENSHNELNPYECDVCGKIFRHLRDVRKHKKVHSGEKPFLCMVCGKRFNVRRALQIHEGVHFGVKPFGCNVCGKKFSQNRHLKDHERVHTGEKPYCCIQCGKRFTSQSGLKFHERIHSEERPYECNVCKKTFRRRDHLRCHEVTHTGEKRYKCNVCGKYFSQQTGLRTHEGIHTGETPYKCNICGKKFSNSHVLKSHGRIHSGEKPFKCNACDKSFSWLASFKIHERIHTGEKPYKCNICERRFTQVGCLSKHMMIHRGERPFECDDCGKKFSQRCHLKRHSMLHTDYNL